MLEADIHPPVCPEGPHNSSMSESLVFLCLALDEIALSLSAP